MFFIYSVNNIFKKLFKIFDPAFEITISSMGNRYNKFRYSESLFGSLKRLVISSFDRT